MTDAYTKVIGKTTCQMDLEDLYMGMEMCMKDSLKMTWPMDMEKYSIKTEMYTKDYGKMTLKTEQDERGSQMVAILKVIIKME